VRERDVLLLGFLKWTKEVEIVLENRAGECLRLLLFFLRSTGSSEESLKRLLYASTSVGRLLVFAVIGMGLISV